MDRHRCATFVDEGAHRLNKPCALTEMDVVPATLGDELTSARIARREVALSGRVYA